MTVESVRTAGNSGSTPSAAAPECDASAIASTKPGQAGTGPPLLTEQGLRPLPLLGRMKFHCSESQQMSAKRPAPFQVARRPMIRPHTSPHFPNAAQEKAG